MGVKYIIPNGLMFQFKLPDVGHLVSRGLRANSGGKERMMSEYPKVTWITDEDGESVLLQLDEDINWHSITIDEAKKLLKELKVVFEEEL